MAKVPYVYSPESDEEDSGMVKIADDYAVWHTFTPDEAERFVRNMQSAIVYARSVARSV